MTTIVPMLMNLITICVDEVKSIWPKIMDKQNTNDRQYYISERPPGSPVNTFLLFTEGDEKKFICWLLSKSCELDPVHKHFQQL